MTLDIKEDPFLFGDCMGFSNNTQALANAIDGTGDADSVQIGDSTVCGTNGANFLYINTFGGDDDVTFGDFTGGKNGRLYIDTGTGNDDVTIGQNTLDSNGVLDISLGTGSDTVSIASMIANNSGSMIADLGADSDADVVVFSNSAYNAQIVNWSAADDSVQVSDLGSWSYDGLNRDGHVTLVGTNAQEIVFVGQDGTASTDVSYYLDAII